MLFPIGLRQAKGLKSPQCYQWSTFKPETRKDFLRNFALAFPYFKCKVFKRQKGDMRYNIFNEEMLRRYISWNHMLCNVLTLFPPWELSKLYYVLCLVAQSYLTLWDPINCGPPGSSVHGILQARILEWVAMPFSRGSSQPRDRTHFSCIAGGFFTIWATREALEAQNYKVLIYSNFRKCISLFPPKCIHLFPLPHCN